MIPSRIGVSAGSRNAAAIALAAGVLMLAAVTIAALTSPLSHDEEQYVAAAVLAARLRPIVDFVYLQTPLQPLLFAPLLAHVSQPFLAARLLSAALSAAACAVGYAIVRQAGRPAWAAGAAGVWMISSTAVQEMAGSARNDALPLLFALGGVAALQRLRRARGTAALGWGALAGLSLGAALDAKLTYVFAPAAGGLWLAWRLARARTGGGALALFMIAVLIGLGPLIYDAAAAPAATMFDVVSFHNRLTGQWYALNGETRLRSPLHQLGFAVLQPIHDLALLAALALVVWGLARTLRRRRDATAAPAAADKGLIGLMLLLSIPPAFAPNPSTAAYMIAPTALAILLAALELPGLGRRKVALAMVALACAAGWTGLARHAPRLLRPSHWTPSRVHGEALEIASRLRALHVSGPVATVSPIRVLDGGGSIYPEFSAGPFLFRSGDALSADQAQQLHAATPATLAALFARTPPAAILTGYETSWRIQADGPLAAYARAAHDCSFPAPGAHAERNGDDAPASPQLASKAACTPPSS